MPSVPGYWRLVLGLWATIMLALVLGTGCSPREQTTTTSGSGDTLRLPPLSKGCQPGAPPSTPEQLAACLKGLDFDGEELAGDRQRLMVFDSMPGPGCPGARSIHNCRLGPLATIAPEVHSHRWPDNTVRREGRIIARLSLEGGEKNGYPKLALVPGHPTYWWVQPGAGPGDGRSVFVSDSAVGGRLVSRERTLRVNHYRGRSVKQALARWEWLADDETSKGTCSSSSSCK